MPSPDLKEPVSTPNGVWRQAFFHHRYILICSALYALTLFGLALAKGAALSEFAIFASIFKIFGLSTICFLGLLVFSFFSQGVVVSLKTGQGVKGVSRIFDEKLASFINSQRPVYGAIGLLVILATSTVCIGKSLFFWYTSYTWDPALADIDHLLFGGFYPHEFLVPFIEKYDLAAFMNVIYLSWFIVMFMLTGYSLFCDTNQARRMRFLWSYLLGWIVIGTILAAWFASVGPLFFNEFYPGLGDPYADLVTHLREVNDRTELNVILVSNLLLEFTINDRVVDFNALSAMPSMHMAIAWLMILYSRHLSRLAFIGFCIYFLLLFAGSVYLGWHYAIDGFVSMVLMSIIWWGLGRALYRAPTSPDQALQS